MASNSKNGSSRSGRKQTAESVGSSAQSQRSRTAGGSKSAAGAKKDTQDGQLQMSLNAEKKADNRRNIGSVILIITGIILGIFLYGGSEGWLAALSPVFFGLLGVAAYALPAFLVIFGVYLLFIEANRIPKLTIWCGTAALFAMLTIVHVSALAANLSEGYFEFIRSSYIYGQAHIGGGALSAIFARALSALLGKNGTIVLLIGVIVIMLFLVTNISFRGRRRFSKNDRPKRGKKKKNEPSEELDDAFIEHSGKPLTAGDFKPKAAEAPAPAAAPQSRNAGGKNADAMGEEHPTAPTAEDVLYIGRESAARKIPLIRDIIGKKHGTGDDLTIFPSEGKFRRENRQMQKVGDDLTIGENRVTHAPAKPQRVVAPAAEARTASYASDSVPFASGKKPFGDKSAADTYEHEAHFAGVHEELIHRNDARKESVPSANAYEAPIFADDIADGVPGEELEATETGCADEEIDNARGWSNPVELPPVEYTDGLDEDMDIPIESSRAKPKSEVRNEMSMGEGVQSAMQLYQRPPLTCLRKPDPAATIASESPEEKARVLLETLNCFGITARIINISVGPVITRFELQPAQGTRVNKITALNKDIALALAAPAIRIEAPIPGKAAIGIEVPNQNTSTVLLRDVLESREFRDSKSPITFALGKDIAGKVITADLGKMPHMLIAGQTGSGKSVCINDIILSLAYKSSPKEVRMILIDPKVVELSMYAPMPHLFCPVVTDAKKAAGALHWAVKEMEQRYNKMATFHTREIDSYNERQENEDDRWPRLVIVIDELAELMLVASKDIEESICRIAQLGRACGIHLIVATQRPSVDVITGLIKANIPTRIAFAVSNATDSRVILDTGGAEQLIGHGDMLFHANGARKARRVQGAFVSEEEVDNVMNFFSETRQQTPSYDEGVLNEMASGSAAIGQGNGKQEDELLPDAVRIIIESGTASTSMLQRRLRVGYARASRLMDIMEQKGYVSVPDGSKPRNVLITAAQYNETFGADKPIHSQ